MPSLPIRLRNPHKLATTTYVNEVASAFNNDISPPVETPDGNADECYIAIPTEALEAGGTYAATILRLRFLLNVDGESGIEVDAQANYPAFMTNATLRNLAENQQDTHLLELDKPVLCVFSGCGVVFTCDVSPPTDFLVTITKDSGSQGTSSTAATWAYTVKDLSGNVLGTEVELYSARAVGVTNFASADSYGKAAYIGGTLYLLQAYKEYRGKATC